MLSTLDILCSHSLFDPHLLLLIFKYVTDETREIKILLDIFDLQRKDIINYCYPSCFEDNYTFLPYCESFYVYCEYNRKIKSDHFNKIKSLNIDCSNLIESDTVLSLISNKVEYSDEHKLKSNVLRSLESLTISFCDGFKGFSLSNLQKLKVLNISSCSNFNEKYLNSLSNLECLRVSQINTFTGISLINLTKLTRFEIVSCRNFNEANIQSLSNLIFISLFNLPHFTGRYLYNCLKLKEIESFSCSIESKYLKPLIHLRNLSIWNNLCLFECDILSDLSLISFDYDEWFNLDRVLNFKDVTLKSIQHLYIQRVSPKIVSCVPNLKVLKLNRMINDNDDCSWISNFKLEKLVCSIPLDFSFISNMISLQTLSVKYLYNCSDICLTNLTSLIITNNSGSGIYLRNFPSLTSLSIVDLNFSNEFNEEYLKYVPKLCSLKLHCCTRFRGTSLNYLPSLCYLKLYLCLNFNEEYMKDFPLLVVERTYGD